VSNLTLRPYQSDILDAVRRSFATGHRAPLVQSACGSGKTAMFAYMAQSSQRRGKTIWFLVHRRELMDQTIATFERFNIPLDTIRIGMVGTVANHPERWPRPDFIIFDECFPAGTVVDNRAIETINTGDTVSSYNHNTETVERRIATHIFKKPVPDRLVRINGSLVCTPNHPIYIAERGDYIAAENLIHGNSMLRRVREADTVGRTAKMEARSVPQERSDILLNGMLKRVLPQKIKPSNERNKQVDGKSQLGAHEGAESDGASRRSGKGISDNETEWLQTAHTRRERSRIHKAPNGAIDGIIGNKPFGRVYCENAYAATESMEVSDALQTGCGYPAEDDCDRDRRRLSQVTERTGGGRKENAVFEIVRVESVEVLERGRNNEFERLCPDGYVYNLEVEGNNNYFADGYLVHNCHHSSAATWQKIIQAFPDAYITGLTATPCRLDGKPLGEVYDDLIVGISTRELIDLGYLAPYRYFAPTVADLSALKRRGRDYDAAQAAQLLSERAVFGDVIKHYREYADGLQAICYCSTVKHSEQTASAFCDEGIEAVSFDGTTPDAVRRGIISRFRNGDIKVLCNCMLISEGLDISGVHCCMLLRPTMSLSLFIQMSMRCMRPDQGKTWFGMACQMKTGSGV